MFLVALKGLACCTDGALAQEEVVSANGQQAPHRSEVYLGIYVLGTLPKDRNLVVGGDEIPRTNVGNGIGAGFKAGIYPAFMTRIIGIEGETFGHSADISAPRTTVNGGTRFANANLILVNTMANLVARYPGDLLQPFVGVGGGLSNAFLTGTDIQRGTDRLTGTTSSTSLAYQFLAGLRANVTNRLFVFGEFKYFVTKYTWDADNSGAVYLPRIQDQACDRWCRFLILDKAICNYLCYELGAKSDACAGRWLRRRRCGRISH